MGFESSHGRVMPVHNLCDYFRTSIDDVIAQQGIELDPHATHYVVNMMTLFSRSEEFYEDDGETYGLKPLALMLADASDAPTPEHRNTILQRIGRRRLVHFRFFCREPRQQSGRHRLLHAHGCECLWVAIRRSTSYLSRPGVRRCIPRTGH